MASSTYLSRTPSSTTNQKTFTISVWIKKSSPVTNEWIIRATNSSGDAGGLYFNPTGNLFCNFEISGSNIVNLKTNRLFRDTNAWYHIILACDTTQGTASDRVKIYINGVQETSFGTTLYPDQNDDLVINRNVPHFIGTDSTGGANIEAVMSHFNFCDGLALAPTVFGSTDSTTGEWKINTSPSFTLGTNGFTILKDGNTITDQSSNSNNWSLSAGTLTKTEDCPSNVFATLNPLDNFYDNVSTLTNGNTTYATSASSGKYTFTPATLGFNSGKFYWEQKITSNVWMGSGISSTQSTGIGNYLGQNTNDYAYYGYQYASGEGSKWTGGTKTNFGANYTTNDILMYAVDCDNLKIYTGKNGTWINSGDPTSGSTGTGAMYTITNPSLTQKGFYFPSACTYDTLASGSNFNFGNGFFGTTAVATNSGNGYQDADGNGIMNYSVPTNYRCLCTKGLNQ